VCDVWRRTPTRSLSTRGAVAPGDTFRLSGLGGITRFAPPDADRPFGYTRGPSARRPPAVAPTPGVRMGRCEARRALRP